MTENNVNRLKYLPSILVMLSSKRHLRIQKILTKKMLQKDRKKKYQAHEYFCGLPNFL